MITLTRYQAGEIIIQEKTTSAKQRMSSTQRRIEVSKELQEQKSTWLRFSNSPVQSLGFER
jgi:hypothetical protein